MDKNTYYKLSMPKNQYSENVIRKSLYWCSEISTWELNQDDANWHITLHVLPNSSKVSLFHRLLNDFILREKLDVETKQLRRSIVTSALKGLKNHVDGI